MNPAWIFRRFAHAIWLALVFLFCGCACDRPTERVGDVGIGVLIGWLSLLAFGAVFGTRERKV